ncbi:MAG: hypothetical protein K8S87_02950, partial [Planctomycetes bacterium]|nr:hypothetical protein [Planctomycetota bacterium]
VDESRIILCLTKSDLHQNENISDKKSFADLLEVSVKTGQNIGMLKKRIVQKLESERSGDFISVSAREKSVLTKAQQGLIELINTDISYENLEMFTEDLKNILRIVGKMTGTSLEVETLSYLFSDFCIGK